MEKPGTEMIFLKFLKSNKNHALSLVVFAFLSLVLTLGRTGTNFHRYSLLTPDAGVYVSFVAAQEHPELFVDDPLLSSEENIADFRMFFYEQVKLFRNFFDNYGSAAMALVPFGIWFHFVGFYVLGWVLFRRSVPAFLTAFLLSAPINLGFLRDFWGIILEPIPRFYYQGFLGLLFAFAIYSGHNIKFWPLILGFAGFINYFHPLSTPPVVIGVALSLWFSVQNETFLRKFLMMFFSGAVLLVVLVPFLQTFFSATDVGVQSQIPYEVAVPIVLERLSVFSLYPEQAVLSFITGFHDPAGRAIWFILWGIAFAGLFIVRSMDSRTDAPLWAIWWMIIGILIGAGLVTTIEHRIYAALSTFPLEFEMYRGMRYIVPLLLLMNLYLMWKVVAIKALPYRLFIFGSLVLMGVWGYYGTIWQKSDVAYAVRHSASCILTGQIVCKLPARDEAFLDMMDALRTRTPEGAKILSEGQEVAIRFYALRPLVYSYKDGPPFAYTNHQSLMAWYDDYQLMNELATMRKHSFRRRGFINNLVKFAYQKDADYLVLSEPYQQDEYNHPALRLIYSNAYYTLFEISKEQ